MRIRTTAGEVLPVLGTIGLLGLWTFQQTGIEERASELRRLAAARSVYQTYQSNNAVFNAIIESVGKKNGPAVDQIRTFQIYNYELGLQAIEESLPPRAKTDLPAAGNAYDPFVDVETKMKLTQQRLEWLQRRLSQEESAISAKATGAKKLYLWLYLGLSVMMVIGAVLKAIDKVFPASEQAKSSEVTG
jgi:hypothetical protein